MERLERGWEPVPAAFALPIGLAGLLVIGGVAPGVRGHGGAAGVLLLAAIMVGVLSAVTTWRGTAGVFVLGVFSAIGFGGPANGVLDFTHTDPPRVLAVLAAVAVTCQGVAFAANRVTASRVTVLTLTEGVTLEGVPATRRRPLGPRRRRPTAWQDLRPAFSRDRQLLGTALAVAGLPALTASLLALGNRLALVDVLLVYLVALIGVTLVGGVWPAVLAAVAASLLINWFFTPPVHHWTIESPKNLLALVLFVLVAVTVSRTVHVAARRAAQASRASAEAQALLTLARTVLAGSDSPGAVLTHLASAYGVRAELTELVADRWVSVARAGEAADDVLPVRLSPRADLRLEVRGWTEDLSPRLLDGFAAQAAAALDRERLRIQASQAEALAEGNRMRTALLAAVSHDLRTPLASVKASVSSLRATDIRLGDEDRAELLETIEESADRLDTLIGNLLDMSRLHTGALQPFLRPTALDEVAPLAVRGLEHASRVRIEIPDDFPLVATDPGLLDRVLANLLGNAIRFSPAGRPPVLTARVEAGAAVVEVIDHGPGIPRQQRARVFEPFQRLGDHRAANGVGLGLAVAKGFTEAIGGAIEARDTPGGGLTMRLRLPLVAGAADPSAANR